MRCWALVSLLLPVAVWDLGSPLPDVYLWVRIAVLRERPSLKIP